MVTDGPKLPAQLLDTEKKRTEGRERRVLKDGGGDYGGHKGTELTIASRKFARMS